jgi:hypothetical protein
VVVEISRCEISTFWCVSDCVARYAASLAMQTRYTKNTYCLLVLDKYESYILVNFQHYCKENKIITLCMQAHSSHLLQPLDVGCFSLLKKSYSKEIKNLMRVHISHITKVEFFAAFKNVFIASFSKANVRGGFRGTGLIPFNPETVISKLDVAPYTLIPTDPPTATIEL